LYKVALCETRTKESGVDGDQDPGTAAEGNSRKEETAPEKNLKNSNETHGSIIVFLDKLTDSIGSGVGLESWLGASWRSCSRADLLRWLDGGNKVGSSVGCDVEDRVYTEGKEGEGVLRREEPYEGHSCRILANGLGYMTKLFTQVLNILISSKSKGTLCWLVWRSGAGAERFVDYNPICHSCGDKGGAIREPSPSGVGVEGYV